MGERKRRPHGSVVRCQGGYLAYVPRELPPPLEWSTRLAAALSAADWTVGQLAGEGRRLANPNLLIRPFVRREAVLSSRIEGTQTTLGELLAVEAGATVTRSAFLKRQRATLAEVRRCLVAYAALSLRLVEVDMALALEVAAAHGMVHDGRKPPAQT